MRHSLATCLMVLVLGALSLPVAADPVWIDVRTVEEHAADSIDGDLNIPLAELDAESLADTIGTDTEVMLYCRSGNRAGQALEKLRAAGFHNITNVGGIDDARRLHSELGDDLEG